MDPAFVSANINLKIGDRVAIISRFDGTNGYLGRSGILTITQVAPDAPSCALGHFEEATRGAVSIETARSAVKDDVVDTIEFYGESMRFQQGRDWL